MRLGDTQLSSNHHRYLAKSRLPTPSYPCQRNHYTALQAATCWLRYGIPTHSPPIARHDFSKAMQRFCNMNCDMLRDDCAAWVVNRYAAIAQHELWTIVRRMQTSSAQRHLEVTILYWASLDAQRAREHLECMMGGHCAYLVHRFCTYSLYIGIFGSQGFFGHACYPPYFLLHWRLDGFFIFKCSSSGWVLNVPLSSIREFAPLTAVVFARL